MGRYRQVARRVAGECPACGVSGRMFSHAVLKPDGSLLDTTGESCGACGWVLDYDSLAPEERTGLLPVWAAAVVVRCIDHTEQAKAEAARLN